MRVGILAGPGIHLDSFFPEIGKGLQEAGNTVTFAAGTPTHRVGSTHLRNLTRRPSPRSVLAPRELRGWVRAQRLDVLLANTATAGFLARLRPLGAPVVYFAHGLHWDDPARWPTFPWQALERLATRHTAQVIVLNQEDQDWFARHAPQLPVTRLPYGVGLPTGSFQRSPHPGGATVVWAGEHSGRKRPELALQVATEVKRRGGHEVRFRLLGTGQLTPALRQQAATAGLTDTVSFPGHVSLEAELAAASLLLHTAAWEGLPRVVLEALGVGRPVLAFDVKGVRRLPAVRTVPNPDVAAMAAAVQSMVDDPGSLTLPPRSALEVSHATTAIESVLRKAVSHA